MAEGAGAGIMSPGDGAAKMGKSDTSDNSRINLLDDADTIAQKIRKARTDADVLPATMDELKGRLEAENLVKIYAPLSDRSAQAVLDESARHGFRAFKPKLAALA